MRSGSRRRRRVEPTEEWEQIELLCAWPEQREYELIRPLVPFCGRASGRAEETSAASERTLQRKVAGFEAEGMESLPLEHDGELRSVERPRLFENSHGLRHPQQRLFALDALGEGGWLKALRLEGYSPRRARPRALQQTLFPYHEAWG